MVDLNDSKLIEYCDPAGMLKHIEEMPGQCQQAWPQALKFTLPAEYADINKIVISGMGGSAISGDLIRNMIISEARLPVTICRDYNLPCFIDGKTLVISSSYSGATEETLSCFEQALLLKARSLVITTGGPLLARARENHIPTFLVTYKSPPRAALPYSLFPIIGILQGLGVISDKSGEVTETISEMQSLLSEINTAVPESNNPAKQFARKIHRRLPVIYGGGITSGVALRWKTQFNENSKSWAFSEVFPELNHNAIVGYEFPPELAANVFVILLRSKLLSERLIQRYRITCQLLDRAGVSHETLDGRGGSVLSQVMNLVLLGDMVSFYLAVLYQVDPSPVKAIDFLKAQLKQ